MKILSSCEDFLNKQETRNRKNTNQFFYNCGGLALNTFSWYMPYISEESNDDFVRELYEEGFDEETACKRLIDKHIDFMIKDFDNTLCEVNPSSNLDNYIRLIAYRVGVDFSDEDMLDTDFHFKIKIDGEWWEKCGEGPVRKASIHNWLNGDFYYNSCTKFLTFKT